jgi:MFS superfamily sulfate permease-like transporter
LTIINWVKNIRLRRDLVAGLTVGVMAVPQAMSYATVAGLPPQYGLYNAFMGLLPYCLFGTSPHLISGPTAVMSILVAGLIPKSLEVPDDSVSDKFRHVDLSCSDPNSEGCDLRIAVALTLSLLAGFIQIGFGILRFGFIVDLVSEPIIVGFTTGSAFLIASTQFTNILGISKSSGDDPWGCNKGILSEGFQGKVCNVIHKLVGGQTSWETMTLGSSCVFVLYMFKYQLRPRLPTRLSLIGNLGPLTVMLVMIPLMWSTGGWNGKIKLVGSVCQLKNSSAFFHPECLPPPRWPLIVSGTKGGNNSSPAASSPSSFSSASVEHHWLIGGQIQWSFSIFSFAATTFSALAGKAVAVAMIGYMESMTIAKTVARTHPDELGQPRRIDSSKELVALGICNLVCSQFSGYPVTGSFSRTAVNADSGANTQLAAAIAASFVGFALLVLTPILQYIPKLALASIVLVAIIKLIKLREASFLWHIKRRDFFVFSVVVFITIFLGVELALIVGVLGSWTLLLSNSNPAQVFLLGNETSSLNRIEDGGRGGGAASGLLQSESAQLGTIAVVKIYSDLSFASAASFKRVVDDAIARTHPRTIILDASSVSDVDGSGYYAIADTASDLRRQDILLYIAGMPAHAHKVIKLAVDYTSNGEWDVTERGDDSSQGPSTRGAAAFKDCGDSGKKGATETAMSATSVLFFTTVEAAGNFAKSTAR